MNQKKNKIEQKNSIAIKIEDELEGYWASDIWEVRLCPVLKDTWKRNYVNLHFHLIKQPALRNEVKYYFYKRLTEYTLSPDTAWRNYVIKDIGYFFNKYFPDVTTFTDIEKDSMLHIYKKHLISRGKPLRKKGLNINSDFIRVFIQLHDFYSSLYDNRDEFSKDIWNFKKINIQFNQVSSNNTINFSYIPNVFRELAKKYIKERLLIHENLAGRTANDYVRMFNLFFSYTNEIHPEWKNLNFLQREDIFGFIERLRKTPNGGYSNARNSFNDSSLTQERVSIIINHLELFLSYIQRFEWVEAPMYPYQKLIVPEDKIFINRSVNRKDTIKYIPDEVWSQVLDNIEFLPKQYIPILIVFEASGFRASDVLTLKMNCLENGENGWWLVGDQSKVKYKSHKVPISEEVAKTIITQQKYIKSISNDINNPQNYLFPTPSGVRVGKPISPQTFSRNLNKFAENCEIRDKDGEIFHFKNHGFRHRYGVNLINNGMKLIHVQKLMAHASPEMTLVYAQIHDSTLRDEWEKARINGAIRLEESGAVVKADILSQAEENGIELKWIRHNLDSIRLDHGFCIKSPKLNCDFLNQSLDPPCIKNNCRSFHVDQTFLSYYEEQVLKMEEDIKIYTKMNRLRPVELISEKLKRYKQIIAGLKNGEGIYGLPKEKREANH